MIFYEFKFLFKFKNYKLEDIGDWGLGIGDWGLGIGPNPQSPIPNPQSPIPHPQTQIKNIFLLGLLKKLIIK